jgi:hypothetical protein
VHTGLWWRSLRKRVHLKNLGVGRRITLKRIFKGGVKWTSPPHDRDKWRAFVVVLMKPPVPLVRGIS